MKVPHQIELTAEELQAFMQRLDQHALEEKDYDLIKNLAETVAFLSQVVENKGVSIARLLRLIFGARTEKTRDVLKQKGEPGSNPATDSPPEKSKARRKGHGRNGAAAYTGAEHVSVPLPGLKAGDPCPVPDCVGGKLYATTSPGVVVKVTGQAPLAVTIFDLEKLRCNLCETIFTAKKPAAACGEKYDETARSMIAIMKYGTGVPFARLGILQDSMGLPLPAATQWDLMESTATRVKPACEELARLAAQGEVVHNDDTTMKVLDLMKENKVLMAGPDPDSERTGMFTSGIVSTVGDQKIALFFTGRKHAGENLTDLFRKRSPDLQPPIQMADALSRNVSKEFEVLLSNCLAHGRRQFVDVVNDFPSECQYVLETLRDVYHFDALAKSQGLSPGDRLAYHQAHSQPLMDALHAWFSAQLNDNLVEPNSGLGRAIKYMLRHWTPLTLFLRCPGAPLDNNICEQALKMTIRHRKNALFYKTLRGSAVGDIFMSLIHTCRLCGANPLDYLNALQRQASKVAACPQNWMPWNFKQTLVADSGH